MKGRIFSVVGGMLLLTVCSKGSQSNVQAAPPSSPVNEPAPPAPSSAVSAAGGTVTGKIKFTGTAPKNPVIDMSEEAACKAKYKTAPPTEENVVAGPANALANVFVYVKAGVPAGQTFTAPATAVVLDQNGCRYHPHVFGIMVGQPLEIQNSDPLLHNIKAIAKANRPFNVSQPNAGMKTSRTFSAPEVMVNLECNVHGWMHAYLGVRPDPFYAVTGPDGSFSIKGLPPGTYTIEAWHEKLGTQTQKVTIAEKESKDISFTFKAPAAATN